MMLFAGKMTRFVQACSCALLVIPLATLSATASEAPTVEDLANDPITDTLVPPEEGPNLSEQPQSSPSGTEDEEAPPGSLSPAESEKELEEQAAPAAPSEPIASRSLARTVQPSTGFDSIPRAVYRGSLPDRIGGATRYDTNVQIAQVVDSQPIGTTRAVFVANGLDFADGLSLGALAQATGWPLFLVAGTSIPQQVRAEIAAVKPTHIYIAGGTSAISLPVEKDLLALGDNAQVIRFAGQTRYETSTMIADYFPKGRPAFLVSGDTYADAVVAAGPSAREDAPIILTPRGALGAPAAAALSTLEPSSVAIIGGTWPAATLDQVAAASDRRPVTTVSGKDRYETAAKVAREYYSGSRDVIYTSGLDFPDALSGISAASVAQAPIVLSRKDCRPESLDSLMSSFDGKKYLLGGPNVIGNQSYANSCQTPPPGSKSDTIARYARSEAAKGYVGLECSDFVRRVYRAAGHPLPSGVMSSYDMAAQGLDVTEKPMPGDIAVMISPAGGHVAIYLGPGPSGKPLIAESQGFSDSVTHVAEAWGKVYKFVRF